MAVNQLVKAFGIAVGLLLFVEAFAIAKAARYDTVDDKYASALSTIGLLVILVALGGFTRPPINQILEAFGYGLAGLGGTLAFRRIANNQRRYRQA